MKVYEVKKKPRTQNLMFDSVEEYRKTFDLAGKPVGDFDFPGLFVSTPKNEKCNFYSFCNYLVFDDIAREALSSEIGCAGELFRIEVEDVGELNLLNVQEKCDKAVNHDLSRWNYYDDGSRGAVLEYKFDADYIVTKSGLFMVPEDRYSRIYAVTGHSDQSGDFYKKYHEAGLTGLKFWQKWTDEK